MSEMVSQTKTHFYKLKFNLRISRLQSWLIIILYNAGKEGIGGLVCETQQAGGPIEY